MKEGPGSWTTMNFGRAGRLLWTAVKCQILCETEDWPMTIYKVAFIVEKLELVLVAYKSPKPNL